MGQSENETRPFSLSISSLSLKEAKKEKKGRRYSDSIYIEEGEEEEEGGYGVLSFGGRFEEGGPVEIEGWRDWV